MTTVTQRALPRTLLVAGLAFAGTIASFGITTAPAHAQAPAKGYNVSLASAVSAPRREVINGVLWNCSGDQCSGPIDGARPANTCAHVVKKFGAITRFATPKGELSAEDLQRCNAAA